jgi:hypothetical protein
VRKGNNKFTNMCRSKALTAGEIVYLFMNPLTKDRVSITLPAYNDLKTHTHPTLPSLF